MKTKKRIKNHLAICLNNEGYPASLEKGKVYVVVNDPEAASHGYLRVIDESGEDYAYSAERFSPAKVSRTAEKLLLGPGTKRRPKKKFPRKSAKGPV